MKHLNASVGEHTIGSPLTLKDVFTKIGQPVFSLNLVKLDTDMHLYPIFLMYLEFQCRILVLRHH